MLTSNMEKLCACLLSSPPGPLVPLNHSKTATMFQGAAGKGALEIWGRSNQGGVWYRVLISFSKVDLSKVLRGNKFFRLVRN